MGATCVAVDAEGAGFLLGMLGTQLGQGADDIGSTVLGQRPGNDFQGSPNSPEGPSLCPLQTYPLVALTNAISQLASLDLSNGEELCLQDLKGRAGCISHGPNQMQCIGKIGFMIPCWVLHMLWQGRCSSCHCLEQCQAKCFC